MKYLVLKNIYHDGQHLKIDELVESDKILAADAFKCLEIPVSKVPPEPTQEATQEAIHELRAELKTEAIQELAVSNLKSEPKLAKKQSKK